MLIFYRVGLPYNIIKRPFISEERSVIILEEIDVIVKEEGREDEDEDLEFNLEKHLVFMKENAFFLGYNRYQFFENDKFFFRYFEDTYFLWKYLENFLLKFLNINNLIINSEFVTSFYFMYIFFFYIQDYNLIILLGCRKNFRLTNARENGDNKNKENEEYA